MTSSAVSTAARVVSEIPGLPLSTRLTVASLTPACLATSARWRGTPATIGRPVARTRFSPRWLGSGHAVPARVRPDRPRRRALGRALPERGAGRLRVDARGHVDHAGAPDPHRRAGRDAAAVRDHVQPLRGTRAARALP